MRPGFYIGEFMYGSEWSKKDGRSGKLYLFDITELDGVGLGNNSYLFRHETLRRLKREGGLPDHWHIVENYPTLQIDSIWSNLVETEKFEGVVFRSLDDTWNVEIQRAKLTKTIDLRVVDFEEGNSSGKYLGSLGALVGVCDKGIKHYVGGGLTDKQRKHIWANKNSYLGRIFVCECKKIFESGKLRHPNFVEWHADKE